MALSPDRTVAFPRKHQPITNVLLAAQLMLYWSCLALVLLPLAFERFLLGRWRARVPIRVHVHGTRGKSSTVRDCARRLREQGLIVLAKTTGDAPEYILPDGSVGTVRRIGPPRIQEHVAILRKAARLGADAVVVEGMALAPENVWQSERILHATHAVITNTRPDHAECMGNGRAGVVRTLGLMIPEGRSLFTAAEEGASRLVMLGARRNCSVSVVASSAFQDQPSCLANAVTQAVIGDRRALRESGLPAQGFPRWTESVGLDTPLRFLDLFSTNDVESSAMLCKAQPHDPSWLRVALLATRADRPLRTRDFLEWLLHERSFDVLCPQGGHAGYVWLRAGLSSRLVKLNPWTDPQAVTKRLGVLASERNKTGVELIGLGNCHGVGMKWRDMMDGSASHAC